MKQFFQISISSARRTMFLGRFEKSVNFYKSKFSLNTHLALLQYLKVIFSSIKISFIFEKLFKYRFSFQQNFAFRKKILKSVGKLAVTIFPKTMHQFCLIGAFILIPNKYAFETKTVHLVFSEEIDSSIEVNALIDFFDYRFYRAYEKN